MRRFAWILLAACLSVLAGACSGISDPSKNTIQDFMGTLEPLAGKDHEFDVNRSGEYTATITALAPDPGAAFNIHLGQFVNGLCTPILGQERIAALNRLALNSTIQKGHYCIRLYDLGIITRTQTYTLRVSHP